MTTINQQQHSTDSDTMSARPATAASAPAKAWASILGSKAAPNQQQQPISRSNAAPTPAESQHKPATAAHQPQLNGVHHAVSSSPVSSQPNATPAPAASAPAAKHAATASPALNGIHEPAHAASPAKAVDTPHVSAESTHVSADKHAALSSATAEATTFSAPTASTGPVKSAWASASTLLNKLGVSSTHSASTNSIANGTAATRTSHELSPSLSTASDPATKPTLGSPRQRHQSSNLSNKPNNRQPNAKARKQSVPAPGGYDLDHQQNANNDLNAHLAALKVSTSSDDQQLKAATIAQLLPSHSAASISSTTTHSEQSTSDSKPSSRRSSPIIASAADTNGSNLHFSTLTSEDALAVERRYNQQSAVNGTTKLQAKTPRHSASSPAMQAADPSAPPSPNQRQPRQPGKKQKNKAAAGQQPGSNTNSPRHANQPQQFDAAGNLVRQLSNSSQLNGPTPNGSAAPSPRGRPHSNKQQQQQYNYRNSPTQQPHHLQQQRYSLNMQPQYIILPDGQQVLAAGGHHYAPILPMYAQRHGVKPQHAAAMPLYAYGAGYAQPQQMPMIHIGGPQAPQPGQHLLHHPAALPAYQTTHQGAALLPTHHYLPAQFAQPPSQPSPAALTEAQQAILQQLEYYFSRDNLVKDMYLREQMSDKGYVAIDKLLTFKRLAQMTNDSQEVERIARMSPTLKVKQHAIRSKSDWYHFTKTPQPEREHEAESSDDESSDIPQPQQPLMYLHPQYAQQHYQYAMPIPGYYQPAPQQMAQPQQQQQQQFSKPANGTIHRSQSVS